MTSPPPPQAGRRMAVRRRPRLTASSAATVVLLLLAVGAVVAAGARHSQPQPPQPTAAEGRPVTDVVAACAPGSARAKILTGSIPAAVPGDTGTLEVRSLAGASSRSTLQRGVMSTLSAGRQPTVLEASGPGAAGHFGLLVDPAHGDLAALRCAPPRATWWFAGAAATLDHTSRLVIANVDAGPAVLDVRVLGEDGPLDTVGTRGVTLAPRSVRTFSLTDIAPKGEDLAIEVHASRGRVAAAVADSYAAGPGARAGSEWLPDQPLPSRVVRVAATPRGSKPTLIVTNPSSLTALVGVRVQGQHGLFTPTEDAQVRVPPDSTRAVNMSGAVGRDTAGLLLRSNVPVLAAVRSVSLGDSVYAGEVRPLEDPAAVAWPAGVHARLLLTAGALPSTASVAAFDQHGNRRGGTVLHLAPGSTVSWKPPGHDAGYLTVTPGSGAVYGAAVLTGGGVAEVPLEGLPMRLERPVVQPASDPYSSP